MNEIRALLERFWIVREQDKELYFEVKRALPSYRRFINEFLGYNLIVNESVIKLEKVPPRSAPWMGIDAFSDLMDYRLLCALLLYLADREDGEVFLLSGLTEAVETFVADVSPVDWKRRPHRLSMVRVLRYAQEIGLLLVYDGSSEEFANSREQEVLYENTGLSRYFPVHFGRDISQCQTVEDFEAFGWGGEGEAEIRRRRVNRVYRQLALTPALYWSADDKDDYDYVKNQRGNLNKVLGETLGGELQVYKNGAYLVQEETDQWGKRHPGTLALSDAALLLCAQLREQVAGKTFDRQPDDRVLLTPREFRIEVARCKGRWGAGWGKQLRDMSEEKLCEALLGYLTDWMLVENHGDHLLLTPAAARWTGRYPGDYTKEAEENEPLEDV